MNHKQESTLSIVAALLVLFTAMIAPPISAAIAITLLVALAVYKYWQSRHIAG